MNKANTIIYIEMIMRSKEKPLFKVRRLNNIISHIHSESSGLDVYESLELIGIVRRLRDNIVSSRI